jgi:toluene monooxygenase system ferredoxin subunit
MTVHRVAALAELWAGDLVPARVAGARLVMVRIGDEVHAYEDRCTHLGVALSEGTLEGSVLTCSAHHWQYDVSTGRGINPSTACLVRFPVTIEHGEVYVEVEPK